MASAPGSRLQRTAVAVGAMLLSWSSALATPSVVIDASSGQILQQEDATRSWYPASLTKLMTAYVALDAVRQGRITLDTPMLVSPRATRMAPSKMGFRSGTEVTLQNALVMLMVKSANDIAVTIAEGVSGSVEAFADEMNRASAQLGMHESYWVNPNGLPDSRQVTSARDLAILGRALYLYFPEQAGLFNIGAMRLGAKVTPTHNGMLGRYPGADGMKTGFTCPAGFNLVASATHGGTRLIAVVLGAPSANARTAKAASLLDRAFQTGSAMGSIAALPTQGVSAAPDMRDSVCRNRGKANAEFMAEVEDMSIPIASGSTGIPLLDSFGGQQQMAISSKEIANLPRPQFAATPVFVGRAAGYAGPVARARAAGAAIGEQPDLAAYTEEAADANASPIGKAATDAKSLRGKGKRGKAVAARPADAAPDDSAAAEAVTAAKPSAKAKSGADKKGADKAGGGKSGKADKAKADKGKADKGKSDAAKGGKAKPTVTAKAQKPGKAK